MNFSFFWLVVFHFFNVLCGARFENVPIDFTAQSKEIVGQEVASTEMLLKRIVEHSQVFIDKIEVIQAETGRCLSLIAGAENEIHDLLGNLQS